MNRLFVYGTLKRGCSNHRELAGQTFVGEARTQPGFRLFDLGGYPGLVPWPDDRDGVAGEVWSVDNEALVRLDRFEGVSAGLYHREPIPLQPPFADEPVHAYLHPHAVDDCREVGAEWRE